MNIKRILVFSTLLTSINSLAAEKLTVYRWIDKNNVVHFSQHQPEHENFTEMSMTNNTKAPALTDNSDKKDSTAANKIGLSEKFIDEVSSDKCKAAKQNLITLQDFDKIQYKNEKGDIKVLSDIEKKQQLAMNTKQVEVYCANK